MPWNCCARREVMRSEGSRPMCTQYHGQTGRRGAAQSAWMEGGPLADRAPACEAVANSSRNEQPVAERGVVMASFNNAARRAHAAANSEGRPGRRRGTRGALRRRPCQCWSPCTVISGACGSSTRPQAASRVPINQGDRASECRPLHTAGEPISPRRPDLAAAGRRGAVS